MTIEKCDLCKKQLKKDAERVVVGPGFFARHELCDKCGKPVIDFLKKKKLWPKK